MRTHPLSILCLTVAVVFVVGCPPEGGWPTPPLDATGTYTGTWQGETDAETAAEDQQEVLACPLTITLEQDLTADFPADHGVSGTVVVDYSCIELPQWVEEIPASTVEVSGLLADDGTLTLLSGGCGTGLCLVMALSGEAVDSDGDGLMDSYSGEWGFAILLAGVQPFGFDGTFQVEAGQ